MGAERILCVVAVSFGLLLAACGSGGGVDQGSADASPLPEPIWAKATTGTGEAFVNAVSATADGGAAVGGRFEGLVTLGAGEATETTLLAADPDSYVARYTSTGDLVWVATDQGPGYTRLEAARVAGIDGSVTAAGYFEGTATFVGAQGAGSTVLTAGAGGESVFVARFASNGALLWAKATSGAGWAEDFTMTDFPDGAVAVGGVFGGSVTFDTGEPSETTVVGAYAESFVSVHNADGTLRWIRTSSSTPGSWANVTTVTAGPDGGVVVAGSFDGTSTWGIGELTETTFTSTLVEADVYLARYGSSGNLLWAHQLAGTGYDDASGLGVAADGSIRLAGTFHETFLAAPQAPPITAAGSKDTYLACFEGDGQFRWVEQVRSDQQIFVYGLNVRPDGTAVLVGSVTGTATFGDDTVFTDPGAGERRAWAAIYQGDAALRWAACYAGTGDSGCFDVDVTADGQLAYVVGSFGQSLTVTDPEDNELVLSETGAMHGFVAQFSLVSPVP